ncbi:uncharacterized protein G2W53_039823 [Senna tora]|uniref:Uncharacterized protein n=1 Tax=Senna tora TaxID=362788 RepID=A0A834STZ4_9FABA|nr:uncharacterized protein G2W53_039823 [Senna tora]
MQERGNREGIKGRRRGCDLRESREKRIEKGRATIAING